MFAYLRVKKLDVRKVIVAQQQLAAYCDANGLYIHRIFTEIAAESHPVWTAMMGALGRASDVDGVVVLNWRHFNPNPHSAKCMADVITERQTWRRKTLRYVFGGSPVWPPAEQ